MNKQKSDFDQEYIEQAETLREAEASTSEQLHDKLAGLLDEFRAAKPTERGEIARHYAVVITELEKALAYLQYFIIMEE